jgi:hydrogenase maturation factor
MAVDLNLPPEITDEELDALWSAYSSTCDDLGIAVVTGHTARYEGCTWPMVGGAVCAAIGSEDAFVTPTMARPGDAIVVTKGAAIEATALFAATFPDRLAQSVGSDAVKAADAMFEQMTVVPEARIASAFGLRDRGVTAMHDATEGGVIGGLTEVAAASEVGLRVDLDAIPVRPEVRAVCDAVGIDPLISISEGTLIATVTPARAEEFVAVLSESSIDAAVVGEIRSPSDGSIATSGGADAELEHPGLDPFWEAFGRWSAEAASS